MRARPSHDWGIVSVLFLLLVGASGTQLCFTLFVKPMAEEFGWSRAAISGAMSLAMAVTGVLGVVMGKATDRYGARAEIAPGVVIGAASYLLMSRMDSLWQFYLLFGLGSGILAGCCYIPAVTVVSTSFESRRRTMALGFVLLGVTVGQMVLSPIVSSVIEDNGWRTAWLVLGIVALACGLPSLVFLRKPRSVDESAGEMTASPTRVRGRSSDGLRTAQAAGTSAFWVLMFSGLVLGLGFYAFTTHIVPYATDVGLSAAAAALTLTVSSAGAVVGTLLAWAIAARIGDRWTLLLLTALNGLVMLLFTGAGRLGVLYLLATLLGFAFAVVVTVRISVVPGLFGLHSVGSIIGYASLSFSLGAIAGPFIAGYIFDRTGHYDVAFIIAGALLILGAATFQFLRAPKAIQEPVEVPAVSAAEGPE